MSSETQASTPARSSHWSLGVVLEDLSTFFDALGIAKDKVEEYVAGCTKNNINSVRGLREQASLRLLQDLGCSREHATLIMRKIFELDTESPEPFQNIPRRRPLLPPSADGVPLLTRTNLIILVS